MIFFKKFFNIIRLEARLDTYVEVVTGQKFLAKNKKGT